MEFKKILGNFLLIMLFCWMLSPIVLAVPSEAELKKELTRFENNLASYQKTFDSLPKLIGTETKDNLNNQLKTVLGLKNTVTTELNIINQRLSEVNKDRKSVV